MHLNQAKHLTHAPFKILKRVITTLLFTSLVLNIILAEPALSSSLTDAVKENNYELALQLLANDHDSINVNAAEKDGTTALMWSIYHNNTELSETLLEAGADANIINRYGSSAMLEVVLASNNANLKLLLKHGVNANWKNAEGESALMIAARSGNIEGVGLLLEHGVDINTKEHWGGQSALMWATAQNQPSIVELLIQHGADVNAVSKKHLWKRRITSEPRPKDMNKGGFTPLLYTAREGCLECARYLINAGADLDISDPDRVTPLSLALLNQHFDVAALLIESGANIDKWDLFGRSPLYMAVDMNTLPTTGHSDIPSADNHSGFDIIQQLLTRGANPNPQLKMRPPYRQAVADRRSDHILSSGATPLLRAAKASDNQVIELLLKYGAHVELPNWMGITPLMVAAGLGRTEEPTRGAFVTEEQSISTLKILIKAGAQINTQTKAYKGQWATLEDDRAFFNDYPWDGQTALHGSAKLGWTEVVEYLVDEGAEMQVPDVNNSTALDLAYGRYNPAYLIAPPLPLTETIKKLEDLCQSSDNCQLPTSNSISTQH